MSSLALLEAKIASSLYVTGKNKVFFVVVGLDGGFCCLSFRYGCGGSDGGYYGAILKQEVGIG